MLNEIIFLVEEDPVRWIFCTIDWGVYLYSGGDDRRVTAFCAGCGELSL